MDYIDIPNKCTCGAYGQVAKQVTEGPYAGTYKTKPCKYCGDSSYYDIKRDKDGIIKVRRTVLAEKKVKSEVQL